MVALIPAAGALPFGAPAARFTPVCFMSARISKPTVNVHSRPGTQDEFVFDEIFKRNVYRLPDRFKAEDVIVDVGAHIGCFSFSCLLRGCGEVWAYEPDQANFELLEKNCGYFTGFTAINKAVWRSDKLEPEVLFSGYDGGLNACGFCTRVEGAVIRGDATNIKYIPAVELDFILEVCGQRRIRLLKIDAEGAEYPALYTCTKLHLVDEICGEAHDLTDYPRIVEKYPHNVHGLKEFLQGQGFQVEVVDQPSQPGNSLFFANRAA